MKLIHFCHVVWYKAFLNLKSQASTSYLGYTWWVLEPVTQLACYYFVFGVLLSRGGEGYIYFLLVGLVPWLWFARTVNMSIGSIRAGKGVIGHFPILKAFFPLVVVVQSLVKQIVIFLLLVLFLLYSGFSPDVSWSYLPLIIYAQLSFIIFASLISAFVVTYVDDFKLVIPALVQFLFFFSGIFYDISSIPENYQGLMSLNPLAVLIDAYRSVLLRDELPRLDEVFIISAAGTALVTIMLVVYRIYDKDVAKAL